MEKSDRPLPPGERQLSPYRISRMSALLSAFNPSARQHLSPSANQRRAQEAARQPARQLRHQTHARIQTQTLQSQQLSFLENHLVKTRGMISEIDI